MAPQWVATAMELRVLKSLARLVLPQASPDLGRPHGLPTCPFTDEKVCTCSCSSPSPRGPVPPSPACVCRGCPYSFKRLPALLVKKDLSLLGVAE